LVGYGCEKAKTPFSANAVQPPENQINVDVYHGSYLVPDILVKAIDPLGNIFTTVTDSKGDALVDPIPFNSGSWILQIPTQSICGINTASQGLTIAPGAGPQTVSFRNTVTISLNVSEKVLDEPYDGTPGIDEGIINVSTSNDCNTIWTLSITPTFGSIQNWTNAQGSDIDSGVSGTYSVINGIQIAFIFEYDAGQNAQFSCTASSSLGSGGSQYILNPGPSNVSWTF
jgi:hypothetical protein